MKKVLIVLLGMLFCVSCVKLHTKYIERNYFLLKTESVAKKPDQSKSDFTVKILRMHVAADFRGTQFTYKVGPNQYMSDYYNCFYVSPSENIQELVRRWFSNNGYFQYALEDVTMVKTDFMVQPYLMEIYGDYNDVNNPKAIIVMAFAFLDNRGQKPELLFYKDYLVKKDIPNKGANDLVDGWNQAIEEILSNFHKDLKEMGQKLEKEKTNE